MRHDPDPTDGLADRLARVHTPLLDLLVERLEEELPTDWTPADRERVREAVRQVLLGFIRYLRIGDLEANECERLRRVVATPVPGVPASEVDDVIRVLRLDVTDVVAVTTGAMDGRTERALDRALERYLGLLRPTAVTADEHDQLDAWLDRIAAAGPIVAPTVAPAEPTDPTAP